MSWFKLHPKVKAALAAALAIGVADVAAQVTDHYPNGRLVPLLAVFVPVVVGYLKGVSPDA